MSAQERKRLAKWLLDDHPGVFFLLLVWVCLPGWIIPFLVGGVLGWVLLLPVMVSPVVLCWGLNSAVLRVRARRGGLVAYEYSLERIEAREKAVQRREDAVRKLERKVQA